MQLRDLLLSTRTIDATVLAQAEAHALQSKLPLAHILVAFNVVEGRRLARLLSRALHFELIDVVAVVVHPKLLEVVPRHAAEQFRVLPIGVKQGVTGSMLYLAMSDPTDDHTVGLVEQATGLQVEPLVCDDAALQRSLDKHYGVLLPDAPVLVVGNLEGANPEFLTESTAEALRFVHTVRSADVVALSDHLEAPTAEVSMQRRPASIALGPDLTVDTKIPRPTSVALGEPPRNRRVDEVATTPSLSPDSVSRRLPTVSPLEEKTLARFDEPTVIPEDEALFDENTDPTRGRENQALKTEVTPERPSTLGPKKKAEAMHVVVASQAKEPLLRAELRELIGPVEVVTDDVAACHLAAGRAALVLIEPQSRSALLRALLDLEELEERPRIIVLGGDPALRLLAFVDHHADAPNDPRAVAVSVLVALRHAGIDV